MRITPTLVSNTLLPGWAALQGGQPAQQQVAKRAFAQVDTQNRCVLTGSVRLARILDDHTIDVLLVSGTRLRA